MRGSSITGRLLPAVILALLSSRAWGQDGAVTVHIARMPMARALVEFAEQARLTIDETGIALDDKVSNSVDGTYSQAQALNNLLTGSGLGFRFIDSATVKIVRSKAARAQPSPALAGPGEDIVVTATKRDTIAQTLPYSIGVVSGDALETFDIRSPHDLTSQFAGLTATNLGLGEDKLFVRGLTDSVLPGLSESVVGVYVDNSRLVDDAPDPDLRLVDIDHVEVLRGPQGTLYGAGSLTGLVRIVTRKPDYDEFEVSGDSEIETTEHGGVSDASDAVINIPITQGLAARLVGYSAEMGGYVDDPLLHKSDTNGTGASGGRLSLGWQPSDSWTVLATTILQDTRSGDSQYYVQGLGPYNRDNLLTEPHNDHLFDVSLTTTVSWDWANLVSNTSIVNRSYSSVFDASDAWTKLTGFPEGPSPFIFQRAIRSYSQETRLTSADAGPWQWLAGISLDHRDENYQSNLSGPDPTGGEIVARHESREDGQNEGAAFGEVSYQINDDFAVTAGVRAFTSAHVVGAVSSGLLVNGRIPANGTNNQTGLAPKLIVKYEPNTNLTVYGQFSEGYRLGGINVNDAAGMTVTSEQTFHSDHLRNYEIGTKLRMFGGRATLDAAVYYEDWRDVQTDEIAPDGAFYIVNAGSVGDPGIELNAAVEPVPNLTLRANLFWNDAALSRSKTLVAGADTGLPGAPSASGGFSAEYTVPVTGDLSGYLLLNDSYVGSSHIGFSDSSPAMGNYSIVDARAGLTWNAWELSVFVDNLADSRGNTFAFGNPFIPENQFTPPVPRTAGLELSYAR